MYDSNEAALEGTSAVEGDCEVDKNQVLREWPTGTKAAKTIHKTNKQKEGAAYRLGEAMAVLAEATVAKNLLLAEQNLLILMTTLDSQISSRAAQRFIRMRQEEELDKYELRREETRLRLEKEAAEIEAAWIEAARLKAEKIARELAEQEETS
jgi:hypothetical protein